jgi:lambda family phage tail tape measure protein
MTQETTSLVLAVDSSQVNTASQALEKMAAAGKGAESASSRLERAFAEMLAETRGLGQSVQQLVELARQSNATATATAAAAQEFRKLSTSGASAAAGLGAVSAKVGDVGTSAGKAAAGAAVAAGALDKVAQSGSGAANALDAFKTSGQGTASAAQAVAASAAQIAASTKSTTQNLAAQAKQTGLNANQAQQLSFQLQDLFVQIQAGQSPLTALIQQGSQLSGTFGGVGGALRAVGSLFTVARVAIGGAAAALVGFGLAIYKGSEQSREFANSLLLTGNAAGITEGKFNALVSSVAAGTKTTLSSSRDALQGLVSSGRFSEVSLSATATAAQLFAKATGQSTDEVVKSFVTLSNGVARGAEEMNRQYHFLSVAQLQNIKELEETGDRQKAITITMEALSARVGQAAQNVGLLEKAWRAAKTAASDAADAISGIGRTRTTDDQLEAARRNLERISKLPQSRDIGQNERNAARVAALREEIESLQEIQRLGLRSAEIDAKRSATQEAEKLFNDLKEKSLTKQVQLAKELEKANKLADNAGLAKDDPARLQVLADIRQKFFEAPPKSSLADYIAQVQRELTSLTGAYASSEAILEATRAAGLVDEKAYYDAKLGFLRLNEAAQVSALQRENRRLAAEKDVGKDATEIANARNARLREIADNEAKIADIQASTAAQGVILSIQQTSATEKVAQSYRDAQAAAENYLDALVRAQEREVNGLGLGNAERSRLAARSQIEDRFEQQRRDTLRAFQETSRNRNPTEDETKAFEERLALISRYQAAELEAYDKGYEARLEKERDFSVGASEAMANYLAEVKNVAKQSERLFTNAFNGLGNALTQFVVTGKADFGSLAESIIADLVRIQIQSSLTSVFSAFLGGAPVKAGGAPASGTDFSLPINGVKLGERAAGGPVAAGGLYRVNEKGPELLSVGGRDYLMMGSQIGSVTPNDKLGSGGGNHQVVNINVAAGAQRTEVMAAIQRSMDVLRAEFGARLQRAGA